MTGGGRMGGRGGGGRHGGSAGGRWGGGGGEAGHCVCTGAVHRTALPSSSSSIAPKGIRGTAGRPPK